ncbi:aliphatic sulfonate ABC transporter substrate-binding protein [Paenibacillus pini]|uniref:Putative aliphatic sulfonates-binding protein n=1 Tax=Paenibacillus pini JCM 16418 TaxID=1236976 RepID=W7YIX9_9BACL|nr:aliphatic sulfonate ABC transporter substrate-binding protein [Paenibacillus pini]GAF08422.1 alkanesulfonates-binding protein [Paenibacillus pini JCM 16418]
MSKPTRNSVNKRRMVLFSILLAAVILLIVGCSNQGNDSKSNTASGGDKAAASGAPVKVNIAINGKISPLSIAKEKGWFEEEFKKQNAEVKWSEFPSGPPLLEALSAGRVDLSFLGDGAVISGIANHLPFEVISLISEGKGSVSILVPPNSPIQKIEDLKGKTVGATKGTVGHVYLIKVLKSRGLTLADVNVINLQPDDGQAAFDSGKLDAWVVWDPYATINVAAKKARVLPIDHPILAPNSMIAHTEFAKEHPELVITYLRVFKKATDWETAHLDESAQIFSEKTKVPVDTIKTIVGKNKPILSPYTQDALDEQQLTSEVLLENGFIKNKITFKDAVNDTFIKEALK